MVRGEPMSVRGDVTQAPGLGKGASAASAASAPADAKPKRKRQRRRPRDWGLALGSRRLSYRRPAEQQSRQRVRHIEGHINILSIAVQQGCTCSQVTNAAFGDDKVSEHVHCKDVSCHLHAGLKHKTRLACADPSPPSPKAWHVAHTTCDGDDLHMTASEGCEVLSCALKIDPKIRVGPSTFRPNRLVYGEPPAHYLLEIRGLRVSQNVNWALGSLAQHARDNNQRLAKSMTEMIDVMEAADRSIKVRKGNARGAEDLTVAKLSRLRFKLTSLTWHGCNPFSGVQAAYVPAARGGAGAGREEPGESRRRRGGNCRAAADHLQLPLSCC